MPDEDSTTENEQHLSRMVKVNVHMAATDLMEHDARPEDEESETYTQNFETYTQSYSEAGAEFLPIL